MTPSDVTVSVERLESVKSKMDRAIYISRLSTDVILSFFFPTIRRRARFARSLFPTPNPLVLAVNKSPAHFISKRTQDPMISKEKIQRLYTKTLVEAKPQRQTSDREDPPDL